MDCYYHHTTKSVGSCDRCNRPICADCFLSFKNKIKYVDRNEIQRGMEEDPYNYEYDPLEELNWCLPCYYAHFSPEILKKDSFSALILDSVLSTVFSFLGLLAVLVVLSFVLHNSGLLNINLTPLLILIFIVLAGSVSRFYCDIFA